MVRGGIITDWRVRLPENLVGRFVAAMEWCMINLLLKHWLKEEMMLAKLF